MRLATLFLEASIWNNFNAIFCAISFFSFFFFEWEIAPYTCAVSVHSQHDNIFLHAACHQGTWTFVDCFRWRNICYIDPVHKQRWKSCFNDETFLWYFIFSYFHFMLDTAQSKYISYPACSFNWFNSEQHLIEVLYFLKLASTFFVCNVFCTFYFWYPVQTLHSLLFYLQIWGFEMWTQSNPNTYPLERCAFH